MVYNVKWRNHPH